MEGMADKVLTKNYLTATVAFQETDASVAIVSKNKTVWQTDGQTERQTDDGEVIPMLTKVTHSKSQN